MIADFALVLAFGAASVFVITYTILVLHELGHLVAARVLGLDADGFSAGAGPKVRFETAGGFSWSFGLIPVKGFISVEFSDVRWKNVMVIAAGPAVNAVLAVLALSAYLHLGYSFVVVLFMFSNFFAVIENLLPRGNTDGRMIRDELRAWRSERRAVVGGTVSASAPAHAAEVAHSG